MSDEDRFAMEGDFDHVTVAGQILQDGEDEIMGACKSILGRLYEPEDVRGGTAWYRNYFNRQMTDELCRKAAFAAMAVLLESPNMDLPIGTETAYMIPEAKP